MLRAEKGRGEIYVPGRCKATNLCRYCRTLYTVETVEMLTLDALEGDRPTLYVVLTAREHLTRADTWDHLRQLRKALRRRWPQAEWFVQVEFQRRGALHLNLAIKGVPVDQADAAGAVLIERWCARVDAEPSGQWAEPIEDAVAVTRYMGKMLAHGMKVEQAPPIGWKGHRTSHTHGYFRNGTPAARAAAQASLQSKRALHRAIEAGHEGADAEAVAQLELLELAETRFELVTVHQTVEGLIVKSRPVTAAYAGGRPVRDLRRLRDGTLIDRRTGEVLPLRGLLLPEGGDAID